MWKTVTGSLVTRRSSVREVLESRGSMAAAWTRCVDEEKGAGLDVFWK